MGVDYRAVLGIGTTLDTKYEVLEFLEENGLLSEEEREYLEENGVTEFYHNSEIQVIGLNAYSGERFFIGYELSPREPDLFAIAVGRSVGNWKLHIKTEVAEIINTVKVY